jgi:anti-anti-sigma factor
MRHGAPWEPMAGMLDWPQPPSSREPLPTQGEAPALFEEGRIVRAHGELDTRTVAPLVRALVEARAARPGRLLLIVDLSEATFTDCSILTPLCEAWSDCRARGGWLRIVCDNHTTDLTPFRHTGLLDRFPAYANAQDVWEGRTADAAFRLTASAFLTAQTQRTAEVDLAHRTTRQDTA